MEQNEAKQRMHILAKENIHSRCINLARTVEEHIEHGAVPYGPDLYRISQYISAVTQHGQLFDIASFNHVKDVIIKAQRTGKAPVQSINERLRVFQDMITIEQYLIEQEREKQEAILEDVKKSNVVANMMSENSTKKDVVENHKSNKAQKEDSSFAKMFDDPDAIAKDIVQKKNQESDSEEGVEKCEKAATKRIRNDDLTLDQASKTKSPKIDELINESQQAEVPSFNT